MRALPTCLQIGQSAESQASAAADWSGAVGRVHSVPGARPESGKDHKMMEKKNDGVWEAEVTPQEGKSDVTVFGAVDKDSKSLQGLYQFTVAT